MDINKTTAAQVTIYAPFKPDEEAPYIFISYSHRDRERVFPIITRLYEKGWRVWYDEGLEVTENYYTSLSRHIKNCTVFLLFLTENSVKSEFVSEHELLLATTMRKRIAICRLDENAEFEGEAKDAIDIATISKKNPKTDEAGLEAALEGIEELPRFAERKAEGFKVNAHQAEILLSDEDDEYDFEKCEGGIRLIEYKGNQTDLEIPKEYKGYPVAELKMNFRGHPHIESIRIPPTVKRIHYLRIDWCTSLTDVYVPSSVRTIDEAWDSYARYWGNLLEFSLHCAENSVAHQHGMKYPHTVKIVIDPSLDIEETIEPAESVDKHYVFCDFSVDCRVEAERIIQRLSENGCSVVSSAALSGKEKNKTYRNAECMIVFFSHEYVDDDEIDYLYRAIEGNKSFIIYALDNCPLPDDIDIARIHDQQLRYDNGTEEDRITKLINWLSEHGCVRGSADIPDYNYTTDSDGGIILTKYTGNKTNIVIPSSYGGHPIVGLSGTFSKCENLLSVSIPHSIKTIDRYTFYLCKNLTALVIPDSVLTIGGFAFGECESLDSVSISASVTVIGRDAFYGCKKLRSVMIYGKNVSIRGAFWHYGETIYCYKDSEAWKYCEEHNLPHKPIDE